VIKLQKLAKFGRVAGPGLILLDGGLRAASVYKDYRANDPRWKRGAFVEGGSFVGGVAALAADKVLKEFIGLTYDQIMK
jgi:hypothetical protein